MAATTPHRPGPPRRDHPLLAAARAAAARGWPVFPVHPYAKHPAVTDWEHQATCDPDTLATWWRVAPYNVGIACGPAGLVVIDCDDGHGHRPPPDWAAHEVTGGRDVLAILAADHGTAVTATYTVATPGGGEHRYHLAPPGPPLRNTVGALGWRIDTRAAGGYVIAAGSTRRVTGRTLRYTVINPGLLTPLPDWILTALTRPPAPPGAPTPTQAGSAVARVDAWVGAAVAGEAHAVREAVPGR
ncbi:MAG TPA: bifunctional DNA primase/polymerase, partial [Mycobacteriales bacterium]|nr:bifunctional DNA primase/polymerase [Mycobacteriales bacterium]